MIKTLKKPLRLLRRQLFLIKQREMLSGLKNKDLTQFDELEFSEEHISVFKEIIEKLKIKFSAHELFMQMKERMSYAELSDLKTLLAFLSANKNKPQSKIGVETVIPQREKSQYPDKLKILYITAQFPNPIHGGGCRVFELIKQKGAKHDVYLYTTYVDEDSEAYKAISPYCKKIKKVDPFCFDNTTEDIYKFIGEKPVDIVHYEWYGAIVNYKSSLGKQHVFTYMENVSLRLLIDLNRNINCDDSWFNILKELFEMLKIELMDPNQMDAQIVVTKADGEFLKLFFPYNDYYVVNCGVDFSDFCLPEIEPEKKSIMFVGHYLHYPNEDAVDYFMNGIFPDVLKEIPDVKIYFVGAEPTEKVLSYHDNKNIVVTGTVDDVRPYMQKALVCMAPLVSGAGIRTKVIQYAALKRVCVATTIAQEGLSFKDGENIFITDEANVFAQRLITLLKNPALAQKMANNAFELAKEHYDYPQLTLALYEVYSRLESSEIEHNNLNG
jgi:glycosyltransferase involved in cell wall biosynthesis